MNILLKEFLIIFIMIMIGIMFLFMILFMIFIILSCIYALSFTPITQPNDDMIEVLITHN